MGWPGPIDYNEAFQHPERVLRDPYLRQCRVEANRRGLPAVRAGGFALVYKLSRGPAVTAARVFLYPSDEREQRYRVVHEHLARCRPKGLIDFGYQPEGIRIGGGWFPVQAMQWVEGVTLGAWLEAAVARGDLARVRRMADRWMELVVDLRAHRVAHGDLQHGNVMVVDGDLPVLVDYDGMCVPGLVGYPALEVGLPAYQHPGRKDQPLGLDLDAFAAWVILIALRAVAADPGLWRRFVADVDNENLLFREADLTEPRTSALWPALQASPDRQVRAWADRLRASLDEPFDRIPPFRPDSPVVPAIAPGAGPRSRVAPPLARGKVRAPAPGGLPPDTVPRRAVEVEEQLAALERLRRVPSAVTRANDTAFRALWAAHAAWLDTRPEALPLKRRHAEVLERLRRHAALIQAITEADRGSGTERAVREAASVLPPGYDEGLRARIAAAEARVASPPPARGTPSTADDPVAALLDAIRAGDHASFLAQVDLRTLRDHPDAFRPFRRVIEGWLRAHVLRTRPIRTTGAPPAVVGATATFRGTWDHPHLVSHCRLATQTDYDSPGRVPDPDTARRVAPDLVRRAGGFVVAIPPRARRLTVTIWPAIDLGWTELRGAPIHLGPYDLPAPPGPSTAPPASRSATP